MTAEEIKAVIRLYCAINYPEWNRGVLVVYDATGTMLGHAAATPASDHSEPLSPATQPCRLMKHR